jgi:late competence protein required for DNA uptake (superfamily II DNA/RNA helicase)
MIINLALRINTACTYARILALVVDASLCVHAIRVLNAFRSATLVRIAGVIGQTSAGTGTITLFTYGVRTARRRVAWQLRWESSCKIKIRRSMHT